jgi:RecA-family ATPase
MKTGDSLMLWAAPGVGKTMASLSIALAVAGGGAFLGWPVRTPRRVLVVDGEMNVGDLRDRLAGLLRGAVGCDARLAGQNILLLARQDQDPDADFPDLATPEGQERVRRDAEEWGAAMVILDNFSTLAEVEDENSASAMTPVVNFLQKMKQAGIATMLVHHSDKGGNNYRGSSKIEATFEAIIEDRQPRHRVRSRVHEVSRHPKRDARAHDGLA